MDYIGNKQEFKRLVKSLWKELKKEQKLQKQDLKRAKKCFKDSVNVFISIHNNDVCGKAKGEKEENSGCIGACGKIKEENAQNSKAKKS